MHEVLNKHGFQMDEVKAEVAWIFASERSRAKTKEKATQWKLRLRGISCTFDLHAKPTRWLGFFVDSRLNWQAHVCHQLALKHHRLRTVSRATSTNRIPRKLARKVAWAVAMSTAAYGIEAIWEAPKTDFCHW